MTDTFTTVAGTIIPADRLVRMHAAPSSLDGGTCWLYGYTLADPTEEDPYATNPFYSFIHVDRFGSRPEVIFQDATRPDAAEMLDRHFNGDADVEALLDSVTP